jgi:hypothetical protein
MRSIGRDAKHPETRRQCEELAQEWELMAASLEQAGQVAEFPSSEAPPYSPPATSKRTTS